MYLYSILLKYKQYVQCTCPYIFNIHMCIYDKPSYIKSKLFLITNIKQENMQAKLKKLNKEKSEIMIV